MLDSAKMAEGERQRIEGAKEGKMEPVQRTSGVFQF